MAASNLDVVTGAFSYTGKYIAERLLSMGKRVRAITEHPDRPDPFGGRVEAFPFNFDNPSKLVESLKGAATLYNTYWIRFDHEDITFDKAVENTKTLISAAEDAGIKRIVHISITNPSENSHLPYFRGKGILEKAIINSKLSYAIIRPTVTFGLEDILINNIVWLLRKFPVFAIPGTGEYKLQPVFAGDVADIAVNAGQKDSNLIIDAVGPEIYTFEELVKLIAKNIHSKARIVYVPRRMALSISKIIGYVENDVLLTRDEIEGLMANLLISDKPATGKARFSDWFSENADKIGTRYSSELKRHYR